MRLNALDWLAIVLTIIGAINWGLIGFFDFDLVRAIFGTRTLASFAIYSIIGIAGLYMIFTIAKQENREEVR